MQCIRMGFRAAVFGAAVFMAMGNATAAPGSAVWKYSDKTRASVQAFWTPERIARAVANPLKVGPIQPVPTPRIFYAPRKYWNVVEGTRLAQASAPFSALGRLGIFKPDGREASCSASVVPSNGRNLLVTAAHCVTPDGITPYAEMAFFADWPDTDGTSQYVFAVEGVVFNSEYRPTSAAASMAYDMAYVRLYPNGDEQQAEDLVGSYGITFGVDAAEGLVQPVAAGFPGLEGYKRIVCPVTPARVNRPSEGIGYMVLGTAQGCALEAGASGGPILRGFSANGQGVQGSIFGVVSAGSASPNGPTLASPLAFQWSQDLYTQASGKTPVRIDPMPR